MWPLEMMAQVEMNSGPSYWGMHSQVDRPTGVDGFTLNPAQLAVSEGVGISMIHRNPYRIEGFQQSLLAVAKSLRHAGWGALWGREAVAGFQGNRWGLAYAKNLGGLQMGIQFNYLQNTAIGYSKQEAFFADLGVSARLKQNFCWGIFIQNPVGGKFWGISTENVATLFRVFAGYQFSPLLHSECQVQKKVGGLTDWKIGLRYQPYPHYIFKIGFAHSGDHPFLEIGWRWQHWIIAVGGESHQLLGMSYGLSLHMWIPRNETDASLSNVGL